MQNKSKSFLMTNSQSQSWWCSHIHACCCLMQEGIYCLQQAYRTYNIEPQSDSSYQLNTIQTQNSGNHHEEAMVFLCLSYMFTIVYWYWSHLLDTAGSCNPRDPAARCWQWGTVPYPYWLVDLWSCWVLHSSLAGWCAKQCTTGGCCDHCSKGLQVQRCYKDM